MEGAERAGINGGVAPPATLGSLLRNSRGRGVILHNLQIIYEGVAPPATLGSLLRNSRGRGVILRDLRIIYEGVAPPATLGSLLRNSRGRGGGGGCAPAATLDF